MLLRLFLFFICVQLIPHAILNIVIDDEIQFLLCETIMLCQHLVYLVDDGLPFLEEFLF